LSYVFWGLFYKCLSFVFFMVLSEVARGVWKSNNDSNVYIFKDLGIAIDCGNRSFYDNFKEELSSVCDLSKIRAVILTHLHYDHIGCYKLFPNARFYCSGQILDDFKKRGNDYILDAGLAEEFDVELHDVSELELPSWYQVIYTPGHCASCLCVYDSVNFILFSGDTLFFKGMVGRYDLPTSSYEDLKESLLKLDKLVIRKLCPGHDY
jgi:hydroxyacylglutathione hydrolase